MNLVNTFSPGKDELKYLDVTYACKHGGEYRTNKKTGQRLNTVTTKQGCPFKMKFVATSDGQNLSCTRIVNEHNHPISEEAFQFDHSQRKLDTK